MRLAIPLAILVAAVAVAAASASPKHARVMLRSTSLGSVLVDARGKTLYLFSADKAGKSACSAQCAAAWPPFLTSGAPLAGPGVKQGMLKTVKRADGKLQVVYAGHPLYFFSGDKGAGATGGQGIDHFGGHWYPVNAIGVKISAQKVPPVVQPPPTQTTGGGYDPGGGYGDGY
jgi:predicted lipoprotein with Yx(FWY)xxD motif